MDFDFNRRSATEMPAKTQTVGSIHGYHHSSLRDAVLSHSF
jgi:hypothetical protein